MGARQQLAVQRLSSVKLELAPLHDTSTEHCCESFARCVSDARRALTQFRTVHPFTTADLRKTCKTVNTGDFRRQNVHKQHFREIVKVRCPCGRVV